MTTPYEVLLSVPELAAGRLPPSTHINAEVRFAQALERACEPHGGVVETYRYCERFLGAWEAAEPRSKGVEPDTWWKAALRAAEAEVWAAIPRPAGALFDVRFPPEPALNAAFVDFGRFEPAGELPF